MQIRSANQKLIPTFVLAVMFVTAVSISASAQANTKEDRFAGTWQGKFNGTVFQVIKLKYKGGKYSGSVSRGNVETDNNGNLVKAELLSGSDPITDSKVEGDTLTITTKEKGSSQSIQFKITLTAPDKAEIAPIIPSAEVAAPKPWTLEKTGKD